MQATLFADDACFSMGHECIETLEKQVNNELEEVSFWFQANKLALNVGKTNFILIKVQLKLNGAVLEQKEDIKYLGVTIDHKLNWKAHIKNCTNNLSKCLWAITKLRRFANTPILKLVYYAVAYPCLQYCISSWGGACKTKLKPLLVKQKLIIKTILHEKYTSPSSPLFHKLTILKLPEIYDLQVSKLMKNQFNKNTFQNLNSLSTVHSHNTRSSSKNNYFLPSVKSNLGKTSFTYYGPLVWNSLPNEVRTTPKFQFKFLLKNHLLERYLH